MFQPGVSQRHDAREVDPISHPSAQGADEAVVGIVSPLETALGLVEVFHLLRMVHPEPVRFALADGGLKHLAVDKRHAEGEQLVVRNFRAGEHATVVWAVAGCVTFAVAAHGKIPFQSQFLHADWVEADLPLRAPFLQCAI